ncbi:anti-anti-sigma factor [Rivularia sp. PCC 7116]|uniref:STAS domain-containing protein n=1 Tax=Rivularia sp. PCC 7116 TaxID=373994 RepID=UPI00029F3C30|nr:STAS domain-containing protein [Rivularia sp. PCC 7116]AFY57203.1 anti-anti-sigma factor [Rivularia sp. PCC 7116]
MTINTKTVAGVNIIEIADNNVDSRTVPDIQQEIFPLIESSNQLIIDLSQVSYMSSAGLRMLLSSYRKVTAKDGKIVVVGLSEQIKDTMSITGFLDFFECSENATTGLALFLEN